MRVLKNMAKQRMPLWHGFFFERVSYYLSAMIVEEWRE